MSVQRAVFEFLNETKTTLPLDADQLTLLAGFLVERRNIQEPTLADYMSAVHSLHIDNCMPWLNTDDKIFLARVIHGFGKHLSFRLTEKFHLTLKVCAAIKPQLDIKHNINDTLI